MVHGKLQRDRTLVIRDGRIAQLRRARSRESLPDGAVVLEAAGKYVIPGLWDMHAHRGGGGPERSLIASSGRPAR